MKCHLHSLDLRQSERAEIPAGKRGSASPAGSGRRWMRSRLSPSPPQLNLRMVRFLEIARAQPVDGDDVLAGQPARRQYQEH
jgi:hypothetical protein